jgi:hypothetical protein
MVYEVVEPATGGRFELERDEPPEEGEFLSQLTVIYKVLRIHPKNDDYDGVLEVERVAGPAETGRAEG